MSRKLGKSFFVTTGLAMLAVSVTSLAVANISTSFDDEKMAAEHAFATEMPEAAGGVALFPGKEGPRCVAETEVLEYLDGDRATIGGEMVTLEAGFDQDFADAWRNVTETQPVPISAVYAHIFPNQSGFNMVDVVEVGADGCAISRTLLTEEEWTAILVKAAGVAV
jgi:hypothetical protein